LGIPLHDINGGNVPLFLRDGSELGMKVDKHVSIGTQPVVCCPAGSACRSNRHRVAAHGVALAFYRSPTDQHT
jgi:hypothetical protein